MLIYISKVGSVNSGSDVISKVYAGPDLVYSAVQPKGYLFRDFDEATGTLSLATGELEDSSEIISIPDYGLFRGFEDCVELTGSVSFPNLESIGNSGMSLCFSGCKGLTGEISFPKLKTIGDYGLDSLFGIQTIVLSGSLIFPQLEIVGEYGMSAAFSSVSGITGVFFPKLTTIKNRGLNGCFQTNSHIKGGVSFDSLVTIGDEGLYNAFNMCSITSVTFPNLESIGKYGMRYAFSDCPLTEEIRFPKLTTIGYKGLQGAFSSISTNVHFKASLSGNTQCTASNLGITGNVYFDL